MTHVSSLFVNLRDCSLLAIAYFLAGYIGLSLAVPPGYATIIWPASGVALCALLVRGWRIWPGVWIGSFALSTIIGIESSSGLDEALTTLATAAAIASGASIQAVAGLLLARPFARAFELSEFRNVIHATLMVVALPSVIAPTIGVTALFAADRIDGGQTFQNWLTWYSGGFLGVILVMPILLLSNKSPVAVRWYKRSLLGASSLVVVSLTTTLLLTFYAWRFISEQENTQAEVSFAVIADEGEEALRHRLQIYERALQAGASFAAVNGGPSPSQWREYVEGLDIAQSYPGMRGYGMFEAVAKEDMPAFRAEFAREFGGRFEIHPQVERKQHFVINRLEPLATNMAALGLDLAFERGRREAIMHSATVRRPVLTRPIVLVQDTHKGAGFLLVLPVVDKSGELTGQWVYSPLVAEELLADLTPRQGIDFTLEAYHGGEPDPNARIFTSGGSQSSPKFAHRRTINLAGQPIMLRWTSLPPLESSHVSSAPIIVLASGLAITILLGVLLLALMRRESLTRREVNVATAELAERNRLLEMAEATAHIGHWQLNLSNNHIRWSDEVYRMHGLEPGDTPALDKAIEFYHPEDRATVEQSIETAATDGKPYAFKARIFSKTGKIRHVEVRGRVEKDERGETTSIIGVIIDRTDETIMRERLTETLEEARAADEAKSSFLANMSHEIRTPMNGVIGFTELALAEEMQPEQKRRLQMIADSGNAMLRLLNDLLDFAKIEAKQMAIVKEAADLQHVLRSCKRLMEPVARGQNLSLRLDIDPALPASVLLDKMRLRQIVLNLLGNALKFTEEGSVTLSASVGGRHSDRSERLLIAVRDTGIGIPADRLETIFDKFTQADDTTARKYGGTGLGLPISAELVELMGGEISVESELGQGSVFTVSLPLEIGTETSREMVRGDEVEQSDPKTGIRILLAEDNPVNQELTMAMVAKSGHDCDLVCDGQEAVDAVLRANQGGRPYDLVLMDLQMPVMDGLQASRKIRDAGVTPESLPIIAVTANAYADDIQRCLDAEMQAHLAKPLRMSELGATIIKWSDRAETRRYQPKQAGPVEVNPRLHAMFEDSIAAAVRAIDAALRKSQIPGEDKRQISGTLHQIAGVAAHFDQPILGEECRACQHELLRTQDDARLRDLMLGIRKNLAEISIFEVAPN